MSWFKTWFNSPWYHLLYEHRDDQDAVQFLEALLIQLNPPAGCSMLDLGCGKGRHATYLNQKGFRVTGLDLSPESILYCRQLENESLSFFVHDMRNLFRTNDFDYVFNLFTSFGYFEREQEHGAAISNAALALKPGGTLVIDFLNCAYVEKNLVHEEVLTKGVIDFEITRYLENGYFIKDIRFKDQGKEHHFQEKVAALDKSDFERFLTGAGMTVLNTFGTYKLEPWNALESPRLILESVKSN
jgi:SAM-dependent methyltransferase